MKRNPYLLKKTKHDHENLTISITILCLERALKRIKSQIKYSEVHAPEQIKDELKDFKLIVKAINLIKHYN